MLINVETKYNIGDMVFVISEDSLHNDWYSNDTCWRVKKDNFREKKSAFPITEIIVRQFKNTLEVVYKIDGFVYLDKNIFTTLEEAQKECDKRNGD